MVKKYRSCSKVDHIISILPKDDRFQGDLLEGFYDNSFEFFQILY